MKKMDESDTAHKMSVGVRVPNIIRNRQSWLNPRLRIEVSMEEANTPATASIPKEIAGMIFLLGLKEQP